VDLLRSNREDILARWSTLVEGRLGGRLTRAELDHDIREIFDLLVGGAAAAGPSALADASFDELRAMLADLSSTRARQGFTPTETAISVFALKEAVLGVLEAHEDLRGYQAFVELSGLVDDLGLAMLESHAAARESVITEQAETLLELSTPVVKLWDGVVALPLVGTLDSARTQVVMEALLQALVDTGSEHAIIDITGVAAVDTQVAQHLLKTVQAARLLGADCIISGIRPQIAQTVVGLGIEFGDIHTKASLADALLLALRSAGYDVVARADQASR
jgi:rsbT co-antagonist protein RsbR